MKVKYNDCTKEQQALIDKYFNRDEINSLVSEAKKRIAEGWDLKRWAKEYNTDVQEFSFDVSFVDVNTDKHMYSVFGENNGHGMWVGNCIDFWDDYYCTYVFEYDWTEDVFFL